MDRPEHFRFASNMGIISAVYPRTWEVDIRSEGGGVVTRALVLTPRLPEVSTDVRPQWCLYGHAAHLQGQPWCVPVSSRLMGPRTPTRDQWVYYEEVGNFRITIDRANELEIRNTAGGAEGDGAVLHQFRIQEIDGVIRLDTPTTRIILKEKDKSITIECDEKLSIECEDAEVNVRHDATVVVGNNAQVDVLGAATIAVGATVDVSAGIGMTFTAPSFTFGGEGGPTVFNLNGFLKVVAA